jgi:cytochrome c oxidase subunit 2
MPIVIKVVSKQDFQKWLKAQEDALKPPAATAPAAAPAAASAAPAARSGAKASA